MDGDVDAIDIDDDDDDYAGIFSIANDCHSEDDDALTGEDNVLSAVHTKRTAVDKDNSTEEFLLTREAFVLFVQDSIADAPDRQKRNAYKHGRASVLLFDDGDLFLLSTVNNLPKHAVTYVGSSKLLPTYIGPFRVLRRMGNAYTIELAFKMRTHPKLYVGRLRQYYQYEPVSRYEEHHRGREQIPPSSGPVSTSQSSRLEKQPAHAVKRCLDELQPARHEENESSVRSQGARTQKRYNRPNDRALGNCNYPLQDRGAHNAESTRKPGNLATVLLHGSSLEHQADSTLEPD
uniref:Tf2-1-like SH3-like domain-containing protein n=1 Tax=Peronospora matthiolae TaxID=2874970 RepID=A0AAV1TJF9_9STRA